MLFVYNYDQMAPFVFKYCKSFRFERISTRDWQRLQKNCAVPILIEDRDFVDHMEVPSLTGHAWIEARPPIRKERVSVHQVDTDEEYAKILQRKYDNEGGVQQVNNRCKVSRAMKTSKYRNLYRLKNLASSQS